MMEGGPPVAPATVVERRRRRHRKLNIRHSHPALYHSIMVLALGSIALAVNFWTSRPTFNPFSIPKEVVGCVFFALGVSQLVFLNVVRDLRMVRLALAASIAVNLAWGLSNTQQWINGKASLQLPILYVAIALLQRPLLTEAPVNPMTEIEK